MGLAMPSQLCFESPEERPSVVFLSRALAQKGADYETCGSHTSNFRAYVPPHTRKIPSTGDTGLHLR